jgi:cobalamin biosynthetic protein CobC
VGAIPAEAWTRLPDPAALEATARTAYGAGPKTEVVAAPGTQALLQWLPRVVPARRVGVLGFTYGEHETCWRAAGADVTAVDTPEELAGFDVGIVVNPNNPDGRIVPPDILATTAGRLARQGGSLIVDEAFMDLPGPSHSLVPRLPREGAIVLRSFGKTYGLAGVRLGFALTSPGVAASLRAALGPWAVSGPAIEIGRLALADTGWLADSVVRLGLASDRLDGLLRSSGLAIAGGTRLFRLAGHPAAASWFARLARCGILTRPFRTKPEWLRFGLPGAPVEWERLEAALRAGAPGL